MYLCWYIYDNVLSMTRKNLLDDVVININMVIPVSESIKNMFKIFNDNGFELYFLL